MGKPGEIPLNLHVHAHVDYRVVEISIIDDFMLNLVYILYLECNKLHSKHVVSAAIAIFRINVSIFLIQKVRLYLQTHHVDAGNSLVCLLIT